MARNLTVKLLSVALSLFLVVGVGSATQPPSSHDGANQTSNSSSSFQRTTAGFFWGLTRLFHGFLLPSEERTPKEVELALVGFGRTGTTSIVAALQDHLGYTCFHDDTLSDVHDILARLYSKDDKPFSMKEFIQECGVRGFDCVFLFTDDFLEFLAQPENDNIKVLLSTRDNGKKWAESWLTIASNIDHFQSRPYIWFQMVQNLLPHFQHIYYEISTLGQPSKYKDLETLEAAYDAHLLKVQRMIPPERLLVYNVKEGWDPLCRFVDKPVPQEKFPHVNDRLVVKGLVFTFWLITWVWPLAPILAFYLLWKLLARIFRKSTATSSAAGDKKED